MGVTLQILSGEKRTQSPLGYYARCTHVFHLGQDVMDTLMLSAEQQSLVAH